MLWELLYGATNTLQLVGIAWFIGLPVGVMGSLFLLRNPEIRGVFRIGAVFLSTVPLLVVLFWLHYPLQSILNVAWPPFATSSSLLAIYIAFLSGDILSDEMIRIRGRFEEAARVLGVPENIFVRKVVFRASFQGSLPRLLTLGIGSIHITMFMSLIGVEELFRVAQRVNSETSRPIEVFSIMAAIYIALCLPLFLLASFFRRHFNYDTGA